ncbi:MAG: contractile injection system protein, VgrG/Pvc8 family [Candidatus Kaistia colombiensis]|nr:MAG: contractile injection system protein, VgrG/Pvc8 family [Kaistia sp.]
MSQTYCVITIDGQDVSSGILPRLTKLSVVDKAGSSSDTCQIELDDTGGALLLPRTGAAIEVMLGSASGVAIVFSGTVDEVQCQGSASGRSMTVSAKGFDSQGKAKEPQRKHWDDKSLGNVLTEAGQLAGIGDVQVIGALASLTRKYWAMQNESFLHFGERIAREVGGTFKIAGKRAILADRSGGTSASGEALPPVSAAWGVNLISWDISPIVGRPRFKAARVRHFDTKAGKYVYETEEIEDPEAKADLVDRFDAPDADQAKARAGAHKKNAERERGGGTIVIDGTTTPQPEATVILSGARPGVDGTYRIETVTHDFESGSGWITRLEVKQPQGDAGKDGRASKAATGGRGGPSSAPTVEAGAVPASNIG